MYLHVVTCYDFNMQKLSMVAKSSVPTEFGTFDMHVFHLGENSPDHIVLTIGEVDSESKLLVRVHSECITSEVFGSVKCDCRKQLVAAQREIASEGKGMLIYLRQEGRGIGLINKLKAYELQNVGYDTVDANRMLGLPDDTREYEVAAQVLKFFDVRSIRLLTNNPEKINSLKTHGIKVEHRNLVCQTGNIAKEYLETKRNRMGHLIPR